MTDNEIIKALECCGESCIVEKCNQVIIETAKEMEGEG